MKAKAMKIVVAGGGPSGLYTAWKLAEQGARLTVVEREPRVGGLAASLRFGDNWYGFGTHHLHASDPERLIPFQNLMGSSLVRLERRLAIKFMGRFYPYPLKTGDILKGMPPITLAASVAGLGWQLIRGRFRDAPPAHAEEAVIRLYGKTLYRILFRNYTTRFWGMPPTAISPTFVDQRMPGINAVEEIKKALSRIGLVRREHLGKNVTIGSGAMYTTALGVGPVFETMAQSIRSLGSEVRTDCSLESVELGAAGVEAVHCRREGRDERLPCDLLVSTIPVNHLAIRLRPAPPPEVREAAEYIGYRGLVVLGLLVKPARPLGSLFTYFPDRTFHRLAEVRNPPARIRPEGASILFAEMTADPGEPLWENPLNGAPAVIRDLVKEGLIEKDTDVLETHVLRAREAYPKYLLGFETHLDRVRAHLKRIPNLLSTGRQGAFRFTPMMPSMEGAWEDTKNILHRLMAVAQH